MVSLLLKNSAKMSMATTARTRIGQTLSRSICKHLVPDFENYLKGLPEDAVGKAAKVLDCGLEQVLATHLMDLGVTASRAIQFSAQLTETVRIADQFTPEDAFKYLEQQMVTTTAEIAKGVKGAKGFGAKPVWSQAGTRSNGPAYYEYRSGFWSLRASISSFASRKPSHGNHHGPPLSFQRCGSKFSESEEGRRELKESDRWSSRWY
jgi:hypothetical protein